MVKGSFYQNIPLVRISVASKLALQSPLFIIDTGFTGDLQVTSKIATELGLEVSGVTQARIANGEVVTVPTANAIASMQGINQTVQVLISDSMPLAGISFLTKFGYTACVDCKRRTIALTP